MLTLAAAFTLVSFLTLLAWIVGIVLLVIVIQWGLGQVGISVPPKIMGALGLLLLLVFLIWFFGGR